MFTQIVIIKIDEALDMYKVTFFNESHVAHTEKIVGMTEVRVTVQTALANLKVANAQS
jgi:hypothetical protein